MLAPSPAAIATPPARPGALGNPALATAAARAGAAAAAIAGPFRVGRNVVVARHGDICEALSRDLEFRIAPINQARIDAVNGPFVLGMDRGDELARERRAIYAALTRIDFPRVGAAAAAAAEARLDAAGRAIDAVGGYARPIAAATARALFGVSGPDETTFQDVARAIFNHTFLNIGGDKAIEARAIAAATLMRAWLSEEIARRRHDGETGGDLMGALMHDPSLDDDAVRRCLGGLLVGSIDTTATVVGKIVAVLGRHKALATRAAADAGDPERLAGWCRELLRFWPHNPVLLRQAACDTKLAGAHIKSGDRLVLWTQAAMWDKSVFPRPAEAQPDRPAGAYLHFGGGLHPCAGRAVNAVQIPALLGALLRRGIRDVGTIAWAGPFPDRVPVRLGGARA